MPHLTLEYTDNVHPEVAFDELFARLHQVLVDVGAIAIGNCKSRARCLDNYFIGDGGSQHAFAHLTIRFLGGRSVDLKRQIGRECLVVLEKALTPSSPLDLQITVEIQEIERTTYFKIPEGTL